MPLDFSCSIRVCVIKEQALKEEVVDKIQGLFLSYIMVCRILT